jgi:hypothetical protein
MFWSFSQSLNSTTYFEKLATWFEFYLNFFWHLHIGHAYGPRLIGGLLGFVYVTWVKYKSNPFIDIENSRDLYLNINILKYWKLELTLKLELCLNL